MDSRLDSESFDSLAPAHFGLSARPIDVARGRALYSRAGGAVDHVESQVLQRFRADATLTHVELLAALLVLIRSSPDSLTATSRLFRPCRSFPSHSIRW